MKTAYLRQNLRHHLWLTELYSSRPIQWSQTWLFCCEYLMNWVVLDYQAIGFQYYIKFQVDKINIIFMTKITTLTLFLLCLFHGYLCLLILFYYSTIKIKKNNYLRLNLIPLWMWIIFLSRICIKNISTIQRHNIMRFLLAQMDVADKLTQLICLYMHL